MAVTDDFEARLESGGAAGIATGVVSGAVLHKRHMGRIREEIDHEAKALIERLDGHQLTFATTDDFRTFMKDLMADYPKQKNALESELTKNEHREKLTVPFDAVPSDDFDDLRQALYVVEHGPRRFKMKASELTL